MLLVIAETPQALAVLFNTFVAVVTTFSASDTKYLSHVRSFTFDILVGLSEHPALSLCVFLGRCVFLPGHPKVKLMEGFLVLF